MKTKYLKIDWLIPVLGIAVVAASLMAAIMYLRLERNIQAAEAFTTTLDRVFLDHRLSVALKTIHDGDVQAAAQRLDLVLCDSILRTDAELASADAQTRTFVEDVFRRIARVRPKMVSSAAAGSAQECFDDQSAAQRILELALAGDHSAHTK